MNAGSQDELASSSRVRAPTMSKADCDVIVLGAGARARVCEGNTGIGSAGRTGQSGGVHRRAAAWGVLDVVKRRVTEWPVEFLNRPRRTERTIPDYLALDAPPKRLDIIRGVARSGWLCAVSGNQGAEQRVALPRRGTV
jgi:hypothetical protein